MAYIKKMSIKNICGPVKKLVPKDEDTAPVMLARIIGSVTGSERGSSNIGGEERPWVKFLGQFAGTNLQTGEEFRSFTCFLPSIVSELLENSQQDGGIIEFAVDIGAAYSDTPIGYEYVFESLVAPDTVDTLSHIAARIPPKALPSPVVMEKATDAATQQAADAKKARTK